MLSHPTHPCCPAFCVLRPTRLLLVLVISVKPPWNLPCLPSPLLPHARALRRLLLLVMLLGPNTVAGSLGVPVMTIGVKR